MAQYSIYEGNMERLQKKLNRISNKCAKFGCSFTFREIGEKFKKVKDEKGRTTTLRFVIIEAEGIARLNGWRFIASIEHNPNGNIINRADYSVEVPEMYYHSNSVCDHCQTNRTRRDTYIVMNEETGEFKRVGKSCLADFTGGLSATNIASYYSCFEELVQGDAVNLSGGYARYFEKTEMLHFFAETVRKFGFVKTAGAGRSTADRAFDYYSVFHDEWMLPEIRYECEKEMRAVNFNQSSVETISDTDSALAWLAEQSESNNYMHNLKTVCGMEYVSSKHFGILASLFPTWKRGIEKDKERCEREQKMAEQRKTSNHVGDVGRRFTINLNSFELTTSWTTEWGTTYLYKMTGTTGNVLVWKSSKWINETDSIKAITGTVKAHSEFNSVPQTELTRCKVA